MVMKIFFIGRRIFAAVLTAILLFAGSAHAALRATFSQANTTTGTTCVISGVSGIQANDIILAFGSSGGSSAVTVTPPSGFAAIPGLSNQGMATLGATLWNEYKIAGGSEPSSYTFTLNQNDFHTCQIRVYSGRNTSSPFSAVAATAASTNSAMPISVSLTGLTAVASDDVVQIVGVGGVSVTDTLSFTQSAGFGNLVSSVVTTANSKQVFGADEINVAGGATGTLTGTLSESSSGHSTQYAGYVLSLAAGTAPAPRQSLPLLGVGS